MCFTPRRRPPRGSDGGASRRRWRLSGRSASECSSPFRLSLPRAGVHLEPRRRASYIHTYQNALARTPSSTCTRRARSSSRERDVSRHAILTVPSHTHTHTHTVAHCVGGVRARYEGCSLRETERDEERERRGTTEQRSDWRM